MRVTIPQPNPVIEWDDKLEAAYNHWYNRQTEVIACAPSMLKQRWLSRLLDKLCKEEMDETR